MNRLMILIVSCFLALASAAFSMQKQPFVRRTTTWTRTQALWERISDKRRRELGIGDDQEEYDLDVAL
jgi:hypothetical protein